ncbi:MAG: FeoB small GTPase domain-containing protein [Bacillota bacterium]
MIKIALAGNPNSGKTTVFNVLTGKLERVGNWSGVTVAKKEAFLKRRYNPTGEPVLIVDLPGAYSLDAYTKDEQQASDVILKENIDVIINIVDASNLERSLYLTTELKKLGIPMVVALNKSDIVERRKTVIDPSVLEEHLECSVVFTRARSKMGLGNLIMTALEKGEKVHRGTTRKRQSKRSRRKGHKNRPSSGCH